MSREIFVFSHIPKTAGTTFGDMLRRNFRSSMVWLPVAFLEGPVPSKRVEHWLHVQPSVACLAGHRFGLHLPWESTTLEFRVTAFVRDPIDRLFSEFNYLRKPGIADATGIATNASDFEDFVKSICLDDKAGTGGYSQFGHLTMGTDQTPRDLELLIESGQLWVFPTQEICKACGVLELEFPDWFHDASIQSLNQNPSRQKPELQPQTLARLRKLMCHDFWLYERAHDFLSERSKAIGEDKLGRQVSDLMRRNRFRKYVKGPLSQFAERVAGALGRW